MPMAVLSTKMERPIPDSSAALNGQKSMRTSSRNAGLLAGIRC